MKTKIVTLMLCLFFVIYVNAQQRTDYFFYSERSDYIVGRDYNSLTPYRTIEEIGFQDVMIESVPVGSGMILLSGFCFIYCILKIKDVER